MTVWAVVFGLTILAGIILIALALMEEQGAKRAGLEYSVEWLV